MNDLKLLVSTETQFFASGDGDNHLEFITFDTNMNSIYACDHDKIYQIDEESNILPVYDLTQENLSNSASNKLVVFQFLTESNNISVINESGDLNLINVLSKSVEGVGSISDGLSAAQWNPDQELLTLITSDTNALILMSKDFDIITEKKLSIDNQVESSFVNVGWGTYETQFKGSAGKNAVKERTEDMAFAWDDRRARICWRSDGEYFVVHFIDSNKNSRKFQIFTREGVLHSTIENNINILDTPIAWKHSKSLITSSIQRFNKHEIIFFEKNGLAHGGFVLPFALGQMKVRGISWNMDSTILCVWSELVDASCESTDFQSVVQLWTMSNYYWYLKQSYNFEMKNKVTCVSWDQEDAYRLHLFTMSGQYISYKLGFIVNCCKPVHEYNGSIAVTDSYNALVTPFKNKVIPPPMSLFKVNCHKPINKIIWSTFNIDLITLLMNNDLVFHRFVKVKDEIQNGLNLGTYDYEKFAQAKIESNILKNHNSSVQHLIWLKPNELVVIIDSSDNLGFKLIEFKISEPVDGISRLTQKFELNLEYEPFNTAFNIKSSHLAIQASTGQVFIYKKENKVWSLIDSQFKFPQPCPNFNVHSLPNKKEVYVGLSQFYRLYLDKIEISNNCNSFYIHDDYLLITDHTNLLKFVNLSKYNDLNGIKSLQEESLRKIERGGKILTALHSDTGCLLQMPRGNIELIHPRTLVVAKLKLDINNFKYLDVVLTMRKHRVNMNILYDHNPQHFLDHLNDFVNQVDDPNLMNLFLTELSDEDTTLTFFKDHYPEKASNHVRRDLNGNLTNSKENSKKISNLCTKLVEICERVNASRYLLVILSCYIKMNDIEKALHRIIQAKESSQGAVDEGLRHLLYIVDVNVLFDVALGTYDFEIVLMVAEKSQKDPKEYLPFLNELKKLEENYRKYKIDLYLKRYKKALQSIVKCNEDRSEEIVKLVNDFKLFSEALKYYHVKDELFKRFSKLFSAHLTEKKYYEEAGLVLFRAELWEHALDMFLKSLNWQMYINVCLKLKLQSNVFMEKLSEMIEKLKTENKHRECASIYEHYLNDPESSILELITGNHWLEAITAIHKSGRFDFFETNLMPSLKSCRNDLSKTIEQFEKKIMNDKERLIEVRKEKATKREREMENELEEGGRNNDDMSVSEMSNTTFDNESVTAKSMASTVNTQFSNKGKKRRGKKTPISLKHGSIYEDLALIQELSDTINYVYGLKDAVCNLSKALLVFNMNELCVSLQGKYEEVIDLIERERNEIWDFPTTNEEANKINFVTYQSSLLENKTEFNRLDIKYRYPPESVSKRAWKLHFYE